MRPIIGITTALEQDRQTLQQTYVAAVERAGGTPVLLPVTRQRETLTPLLNRLNGLLIPGGPGITDGLIGRLPPDLPPVSPTRHRIDTWAFEAARANRLPILGICYGMQFINARHGGTLYADVQHQCGAPPHSPKRTGGKPVWHTIHIQPGTHLAALVGNAPPSLEANSFHIQAVETPGRGLQINARSEDGHIEGLETQDGRTIGVQFHPEKNPGTPWDRLFDHLIQCAQK